MNSKCPFLNSASTESSAGTAARDAIRAGFSLPVQTLSTDDQSPGLSTSDDSPAPASKKGNSKSLLATSFRMGKSVSKESQSSDTDNEPLSMVTDNAPELSDDSPAPALKKGTSNSLLATTFHLSKSLSGQSVSRDIDGSQSSRLNFKNIKDRFKYSVVKALAYKTTIEIADAPQDFLGGREKLFDIVRKLTSWSFTSKDIAIVKEGYNKCLAFRDNLFFESLAERWFYLYPNAVKVLGLEVEDILVFLYGWIDLAVHSLQPETEVLYRESFQPLHVKESQRFPTMESYAIHLIILGMNEDALLALDEAWYFALSTHVPYFEESDYEELKDREKAPLVRFFRQFVLGSFLQGENTLEELGKSCSEIHKEWAVTVVGTKKIELGRNFFRSLFTQSPELLDHFVDADIDHFAIEHVDAIQKFLISADKLSMTLPIAMKLASIYRRLLIPSWTYPLFVATLLKLCKELFGSKWTDKYQSDMGTWLAAIYRVIAFPFYLVEKMAHEANDFFGQAAEHFGWSAEILNQRKLTALREIHATNTHHLSAEELSFGAQLAWRNSGKCCGRISWNTLLVRDRRHVDSPIAIFEECVEHQRLATAGTNLQSVMTIFREKRFCERWGPRIWNSQFMRFACWELPDGSVIGDTANKELTKHITRLWPSWVPKVKTAFDLLPLVVCVPGQPPMMFHIPTDVGFLIEIEHPDNEQVKSLGFRWCAVPTITNFNLRLAGINYGCCPFNGWFLDLEVGRNLLDRYGAADKFVEIFPNLKSLKDAGDAAWRDIAMIEITRAVYYSFTKSKMTMVNRETVSRQFAVHLERERACGREVPAQWSWIGGLLGPVYSTWKHECRDFFRPPEYQYQSDMYLVVPHFTKQLKYLALGDKEGDSKDDDARQNALNIIKSSMVSVSILYGSETGSAESFARKTASELKLLTPQVASLNEASTAEGRELLLSDVVLIITSTFGTGLPPTNASKFLVETAAAPLPDLTSSKDKHVPVKLAVCALGSTVYPDFAAYGWKVWRTLKERGADVLTEIVTADECSGQAQKFSSWLDEVKMLLLPVALKSALQLVSPPVPKTLIRSCQTDEGALSTSVYERTDSSKHFVPKERGSFKLCPVVANYELRNASYVQEGRSTHRIEIDITILGEEAYSTGDHCAIMPVCPYVDVYKLCTALGVSLHDTIVCLAGIESTSATEGNNEVVVGDKIYSVVGPSTELGYDGLSWLELFSITVETTLLVSILGELVDLMAAATNLPGRGESPPPAESMIALVDRAKGWKNGMFSVRKQNRDDEDFVDEYVHLSTLLSAYPGIAARIDLVGLLTILPKRKPRYYSISSSNLVSPHTVALTVGLVLQTTKKGTVRKGACSTYLHECEVGQKVLVNMKKSDFRLPTDPLIPVIMVGPGTGMAPFAGFLDHRLQQIKNKEKVGLTLCFTGASYNDDLIYDKAKERWESESGGAIRIITAVSREGSKMRVTHAIERSAEEIVEAMLENNGHYYCCGNSQTAEDTVSAITNSIAKVKQVPNLYAKDSIHAFREEGRYQYDVWGQVTFFSKELGQSSNANAMKAKKWLEALL